VQAISEKSDEYYTYEEASQVLGVSYVHLARAVGRGAFHPIPSRMGARKYLLKSEVDAKVGQQLYTERKPPKNKVLQEYKDAIVRQSGVDIESLVREEAREEVHRELQSFRDVLKSFTHALESLYPSLQTVSKEPSTGHPHSNESEVGSATSFPGFRHYARP
jgi:predicted site-specific integrase-resolvase